MTEKELKRLRRADLLELLLEQSRENARLRRELEEARAELEDRTIRIENSGTMAEAAVALSGVFEAAQSACDLYLENIRLRNQEAEQYKDNILRQLQDLCGTCPILQTICEWGQQEDQEQSHESKTY